MLLVQHIKLIYQLNVCLFDKQNLLFISECLSLKIYYGTQ